MRLKKLVSLPTQSLKAMIMLLASIACLPAAPGQSYADDSYSMGVFPHLPPRELEKVFSPMAADLGDAIQNKILLRSSTTYERFMENLDKEIFDIVFVQPFDYIRIADRYGYRPLATRSEKLSSIVVTKKDNTLNSLNDLKGKKVALPPSVSAVSYLFKGHLRRSGMIAGTDVSISHHRSHVSCMQQILIGRADACGTAKPALRFFQHRMKVELKIIAESAKIPHTLFAVHPRIPIQEQDLLKQRILSWGSTANGKKLLERGRLKPFIPISDQDYNVVRDIPR